MGEFPPHLWTLTVGQDADRSEFAFFKHPSGLNGFKYKHGVWPVKTKQKLSPGKLDPQNVRLFFSLYYFRCPLCHCIKSSSELLLKERSPVFIACSGWSGNVACPGYYATFYQSESTCVIQ